MKTNYPPATILGCHTRMLRSTIVNDEYELSIYLPPSYESSEQRYPTLYVLDSPMVFSSAVTGAYYQNWNSVVGVPEMIVVGIGKQMKSLDEWWPIRERDYLPIAPPNNPDMGGQADAFLNFFDQELIPFIDTNYRTQQDDRIIWGASMGGIFVLYAMFNKTHLFHRYISTCPSFVLGGKIVFDYEQILASESLPLEARLFVSVGTADHEFAPNVEAFMSALSARALPNLKFKTFLVDGLGHAPALLPSLVYGIEAVYAL